MELTLVFDALSRLVVSIVVLGVALWSWMSGRMDTSSSPCVSLVFTFVLSFLFEDTLFKTEFLLNTLQTQTDNEIDFEP